jgi:two-component system, sensor histidine kinase RegB
MSLVRPKTRGAILLARATPPGPESADQWLIGLRWIAIAGMFATTIIAERLVPSLPLSPLLTILAATVGLNLGWTFLSLRRPSPRLLPAQIISDVLPLTAMLWFSGGAENPFAAFMTFHIVLAGLLCGWRVALAVVGLSLAAFALLAFAPALPLDGARFGAERVKHIGDLVSLFTLAGFIGFFVFIYVQRVEELRTQAQRHSKLAMLGQLVGAMSHELNTPLATILLASRDLAEVGEHLSRQAGDEDAADVVRLSKTVAGEAQRAADIIGMMRGHVRPDEASEDVDLAAFVRQVAEKELDRLGFTGERRLPAPEPVPARILKAGLAQVLVNVLTNAVQATHRQPHAVIEVAVADRRGRYEVTVRDDGPGIAPEVLGRLGEPFHTTKQGGGGMGLGLYVSSVLAERMDGVLHVESPAGPTGTQVTLSLKKSRPSGQRPAVTDQGGS